MELSVALPTSGLGFKRRINIFLVQATLLCFLLLVAQGSLIDSESGRCIIQTPVGKRVLEGSEGGLGQ